MLKSCQWGSQYVDCDEVFNNDLTDEGLCCSFNRLPPSLIFRNLKDISILNQTFPNNVYDWNAEKGFEDAEYGEFTIPRRPLGAGAHLGLSVVLDAQVANYHCSSTRSIGFKVILANPIETPKMADFGFLISPGFETRVTIEPSVREATETLRDVAVQKRQCYFSNERPLQYYRFYSQRNCLLECQSNYTLNLCECVPYYLPKNKQIKYCGKIEKFCVETAKNDMETVVGNGSTSLFKIFHVSLACVSSPHSSARTFRQNMAVVQFYFYNSKFTKELKSQLYGFTEILSNVGGLLSLCLGFSFLSLVEIFYFITLRLCCEVFHRKVTRNQKLIPFLR
ncbi:pickpocket protein 28-like [Dendroctonus ponderosae]|uniref:pickpocket protein 28-like n=1 Tax=Dendroctonus ponderosae TaxID=77166 RepID=UPI002034B15C|nr:pickpocket protein 28-like [Dendroctonus ponderosae]